MQCPNCEKPLLAFYHALTCRHRVECADCGYSTGWMTSEGLYALVELVRAMLPQLAAKPETWRDRPPLL